MGQPKKGPYLRIRGFAICGRKKNTEEHAPTQKTPIQNKMFATVRLCICVFVSELTKSQPKAVILLGRYGLPRNSREHFFLDGVFCVFVEVDVFLFDVAFTNTQKNVCRVKRYVKKLFSSLLPRECPYCYYRGGHFKYNKAQWRPPDESRCGACHTGGSS